MGWDEVCKGARVVVWASKVDVLEREIQAHITYSQETGVTMATVHPQCSPFYVIVNHLPMQYARHTAVEPLASA